MPPPIPPHAGSAPFTTTRRVGATHVELTTLGYGAAPIGNLYTEVDEAQAIDSIHAALANGIRYFDTAPYYGYGLSERRLGAALQDVPRDQVVLSTKVGRCVSRDDSATGLDGFAVPGFRAAFDYSRDGILRAFESSLARLRTDRIDILLLHDIGRLTHGERHPETLRQALDEALPAMAELKASGACDAIGIGVNEQEIALELLPRFPLDCVMLAGRYTLLEQNDARRVLAAALQHNASILVAGPYNSGLMGHAGAPGATYNYGEVDAATLQRAQRIYAACATHQVDVGALALQFPLAHPAVATVVAGMRSAEEATAAARRLRTQVPDAAWRDLHAAGLLAPWTPTP